nr:hypothetical protein [Tanacetum cinerariifolium]
MASRVQLSGRITALTTDNATLKARVTGKQNSGSKSLAKPKVTATGMVSDTTKHSSRPTPTRMVQQQWQPAIPISHSTRRVDQKRNLTNQNRVASDWRTYRTCFISQPSLGCPTRNERLSSRNRDSYVVQNWKPINHKTTTIKHVFQPVKQVVTPVKKVWKATGKVFARVGFHWKPTRRMFTLDDMCPLNRITPSKVLPVEHSSSVSTSVDVVVSSRFTEMLVTSYKRKGVHIMMMSVHISSGLVLQTTRRVYVSVRFIFEGREIFYGNPDHKPLGKYVAKKTAVPNS